MGRPVAASGSVMAPVPGPISRNASPRLGPDGLDDPGRPGGRQKMLSESLARPARGPSFAALSRHRLRIASSPRQYSFLDRFDLLFGQPEVVPDLVDQRLADRHDDIVFIFGSRPRSGVEERDLVGQRVAMRPLAFGERCAFVEAEQRVGRLDADFASCAVDGSSSTTMAMFWSARENSAECRRVPR